MPWQQKFRAILSVYLVLENDKGEVLLHLRKNTGFKDGEFGLPAGHVDGNERLHDAMIREAKEECGLDIAQEDLTLVHVMHRHCADHERVDFFFWCTRWSGEPQNIEPDKCAGLFWHPLANLPEHTIDYYKHMFAAVGRGERLSYFGWDNTTL